MPRSRLAKGCLLPILILIGLVGLIGLAVIVTALQARREPSGDPEYVALGSSYAAGAGLGPLQKGGFWLCARSVGGYPPRLAALRRLSVVDMSCGGAVTRHLLHGGQVFQAAQVRAVTSRTRLVTLTVGGNDTGYVGDMSMLAARRSGGFGGWMARTLWKGPKPVETRDWTRLHDELLATVREVRRRAPGARVVVATYPTVLPATGTCDVIRMSPAEVALMRRVGDRLAEVTRTAAIEGGAILVDMNARGAGHDACSTDPWVTGWTNAKLARFHPTAAGAKAIARAIDAALGT